MPDMEFFIQRWAAWAPGLDTPAQWRSWARSDEALIDDGSSPSLPFVEPMLRRRCSRLSRMALQACFQCLDGNIHSEPPIRTIFCSRHGEIHRTKTLLDDIVRQLPISPMAFSLSVHNTASGLYSIASGNTAPSSAIAAGVDTLEMAVVDSLGHLHQHPGRPVMVVLADEPLPAFYQRYDTELTMPHGLALLLNSRHGGVEAGTAVRLRTLPPLAASDSERRGPHSLSVLRWLCGTATCCQVRGERLVWQWSHRDG